VGLPPLGKFAQSKEGGDVPVLQGYLEDYLHVAPQSGELQGAPLAELNAMRAQYIHNYPELLTGAALQALLKDVPAKGAGSFYDTCLEGIKVGEEEALFNSMYVQLNEEQKRFVDVAVKGLEYQVVRMGALMEEEEVPAPPHNLPSLHHLQARGGRGKSFVNSCLIAKALSMGLLVSCSAFTGVAAIILRRGQTCHRTYGLQLDVSEPQPSTLTTRSVQGKRLAYTALHVIDEVDRGALTLKEGQLKIEHYWAGALRRAVIDGDVERGSLMAGQSVGMVQRIQTAQEIVDELVQQASLYLLQKNAA
jgi:hypothetical protein